MTRYSNALGWMGLLIGISVIVFYWVNKDSCAASQSERIDPTISFRPVGIVHSPYNETNKPPRQGRLAPTVTSKIEIFKEFEDGLDGIEDFDRIYVLFVFDRSTGWNARVTPPGATKPRGVFATRSPRRPCPIGLTVVELNKRDGRYIYVNGLDAFDRTPVLDIKPYIGGIDAFPNAGDSMDKDLGLKP